MLFTRTISALMGIAAIAAQPMRAANAFQARVFEASGPVTVSANQTASICATNLGSQPAKVLLALLDAMPTPAANNPAPGNQILAVREAALDPGQGVCFSKTGSDLPTGKGTPGGGEIVAVMVEGGIFSGTTDQNGLVIQSGIISQKVLGGVFGVAVEGGIVASLQILNAGTPVLYPQMALKTVNPGPPTTR